MTDYAWPVELAPYSVSFYLQPHTGGSESPFSRQSKIYGLSAPRWISSLSFRGGDSPEWGVTAAALLGQRMDGFLAKLEGRTNRVIFGDMRRRRMSTEIWPLAAGNLAAAMGATTITITGLPPGMPVMAGDYVGGDGRAHIVTDTVYADISGSALASFKPPLKSAISANAATFGGDAATSTFRLTNDDAGQNPSQIGDLTIYQLSFVEDL